MGSELNLHNFTPIFKFTLLKRGKLNAAALRFLNETFKELSKLTNFSTASMILKI